MSEPRDKKGGRCVKNSKYVKAGYVSKLFDVTLQCVARWVREGKIPGYITPGGHARIPKNEIDKIYEKSQNDYDKK